MKAARAKWIITYKGTSGKLSADLSSETLGAGRQEANIFKELKEKKKLPTKNSMCNKTALQKWERNQDSHSNKNWTKARWKESTLANTSKPYGKMRSQ